MLAVLGAVIAGGASERYGSPKALATVGGERIIDRVIGALEGVADQTVLIVNTEAIARAVPLESRADIIRGAGALGGIHSALTWADEREMDGILAVACDMPFVGAPLLRAIMGEAAASNADVVVPESGGRRGIEPLCAYYAVRGLPAIRAALDRGDQRMIAFHADVLVRRLPIGVVRGFGDPDILFMNVNTPEDRALAERLAGANRA
jgi:molybdopterin-guanine dinucleotide biosynthesis protein A